MNKVRFVRPWVALLALVGCAEPQATEWSEAGTSLEPVIQDESPLRAQGDDEGTVTAAADSLQLQGEELARAGFELAPNPARASKKSADEAAELPSAEARARFNPEADRTWYAADGTRYTGMLVLADGTTYGQRGPSPVMPQPSAANRYGGWQGEGPTEAEIAAGIERLESGEGEVALPNAPGPVAPGILGTSLAQDRRTRVFNNATLQSYPSRTIGAINTSVVAGETYCTGTKVGPRHVLTASHCVLRSDGWVINRPGTTWYFHPGQTNSTHPNTNAIRIVATYATDWNIHSQWDYGLIVLADRADSTALGWVGMSWWDNAAGYNNRQVSVRGYPGRSHSHQSKKCQASPLANKNCDGWMYRDGRALTTSSFLTGSGELQYNIDTTAGQSGSSVLFQHTDGGFSSLGVHWGCGHETDTFGGCSPGNNQASRLRPVMYNDLCNWMKLFPSAFGAHPSCH